MEYEKLDELLDIIDLDMKYWCNKMEYNCNSNCKYYRCICSTAEDDIKNVKKLAAVCFNEEND